MKIRYITPFSVHKNIGRAYNEAISELPDDCYVCIRDGDTMFLTPDWGVLIEQIIKANPDYDVITCMTNRVGLKDCLLFGEFRECEISDHIWAAQRCWYENGTEVKQTSVAPGMLMIFNKSVWLKHKFKENSIIFDRQFSESVTKSGGKIGVAKGLYIFHLYRWGSKNPQNNSYHLIKNRNES